MTENKFLIYSSGYNCEKYIKTHIDMIQRQTYKNYRHLIVDDASTDKTYGFSLRMSDTKTTIFQNITNLGWVHNSTLYLTPKEDEIVIIVDLDDWLMHDHVLEIINEYYNKYNCWLTYGSFIWLKQKCIEGIEYPEDIRRNKQYRSFEWRCVHPQTFRGFLWNRLSKELLKGQDGKFFSTTYDQAIILPMLEMCPYDKVQFIKETLYCYNSLNPLCDSYIHRSDQIRTSKYIRSLPQERELEYDNL